MTDAPPVIPRATYRLQFGKNLTFADAARLLPYLDRLGVSHLYASPFLDARAESPHGYDITDYGSLNPQIGGDEGLAALARELGHFGMGQILDFVPNHMGIGKADNAWWLDVLEWGQTSPYAGYFDIDWRPAKPELRGKVLLPFLGDHYGHVIERGELALRFDADEGGFAVWYHEHRFPIGPRHYWYVLVAQSTAERKAGREQTAAILEDIIGRSRALRSTSQSRRRRAALRDRGLALKRDLAVLYRSDVRVREAIDRAVEHFCGDPAQPRSFVPLHRLLERQAYRLAYWRVASDEINYRRFFDINELAGIRMERPDLFEIAHRLIHDLVGRNVLHGLRIDHIDGLFDPARYCRRLADEFRSGNAAERPGIYLLVEKILGSDESLRASWPVHGTTGYEVMNQINGLFVQPAGEWSLSRVYRRFSGETAPYADVLYDSKRYVVEHLLSSELQVLANELDRISESNWHTRDFTLPGLRAVLEEVTACFPVYRTYVDERGATAEDREQIDAAFRVARRRSPGRARTIFEFVHGALTGDLVRRRRSGYSRSQVLRFAMKYQQFTSPVMAKSLEDTSFYRYNRLISLNEVGGDPERFGLSVAAFHAANRARMRDWPHNMVTTSTHDSKRGEDTRARLNVLSEMPDEWGRRVARWSRLNRRGRTGRDRGTMPSRNHEYFLYQTLVGSWPNDMLGEGLPDPDLLGRFTKRVLECMTKAVREGKVDSSWAEPDPEYEDALRSFVERVLDPARGSAFLEDFRTFETAVAWFGMLNGLSQTVLKFTVPGVPDIYQGSELWNLSMVDPDNRRPVDFERRSRMLGALDAELSPGRTVERGSLERLLDGWPDGRIKLFVTSRLLQLRRHKSGLFSDGDYLPSNVTGAREDHICAFARADRDDAVLVIAPRLFCGLAPAGVWPGPSHWGDTCIAVPDDGPDRTWGDVFTGAVHAVRHDDAGRSLLSVADMLDPLPFAVLAARGTADAGSAG